MTAASLVSRILALPAGARAVGLVMMLLALGIGVAATLFAHSRSDTLFAAPLHPDQLAEVEERLAGWNVAFTPLADNVIVDVKRRSDLLLRLSLAGVPHAHLDGTGDVLEKLGALTPQAVIDAQTRDGLAADIAMGLRGIDGVQDARVIIAPAKPGYFADEQSRDASASVRMRMAPGMHLSGEAVAGIRAFVAASVPGLTPRNVTIVDDRGIALDDTGAGEVVDLQRSLQSALDAAVGAGAAIVRVRIEYDRRSIITKDVRRSPLSPIAISSDTQDEHFSGDGKQYGKSAQQLDRGSDTRETQTQTSAPRVARIAAAVIVDGARVSDLAQIKALAAATLGIDSRRGDSLDVEAVSFSHQLQAKKDAWWLAYGAIVPLLPALMFAVVVLCVVRAGSAPLNSLVRMFAERARIAQTSRLTQGVPAAKVRGALMNEPPHAAAAIISALPAATAAAVLDLYPEAERAAIVRRMQRPSSPLLAQADTLLHDA